MSTQTYDLSLPKPLSEIMDYQNQRLLDNFCKKYSASMDEAEKRFIGLKQFFVVCGLMPGYKVVSEPIDAMWHTFLAFTKDYRKFCETYIGMFIDHAPFEKAVPNAYLETRGFAEKIFGDLDEQLWSKEAKADCSSGCGE